MNETFVNEVFWTTAVVACGVALVFVYKRRALAMFGTECSTEDLARGQQKDNWLTCAAVWSVLARSHEWQGRSIVQVAEATILTWMLGGQS